MRLRILSRSLLLMLLVGCASKDPHTVQIICKESWEIVHEVRASVTSTSPARTFVNILLERHSVEYVLL